jgi:hypothetical protein
MSLFCRISRIKFQEEKQEYELGEGPKNCLRRNAEQAQLVPQLAETLLQKTSKLHNREV